MTATGQLMLLPVSAPVRIQDSGREAAFRMDPSPSRLPSRQPRIYRIPNMESWVGAGVYSPDGRMTGEPISGQRIDLMA